MLNETFSVIFKHRVLLENSSKTHGSNLINGRYIILEKERQAAHDEYQFIGSKHSIIQESLIDTCPYLKKNIYFMSKIIIIIIMHVKLSLKDNITQRSPLSSVKINMRINEF